MTKKKGKEPVVKIKKRGNETAESMAARQRDISVSEFFAKNRHLLGFDNPRKALLTAIKEAVDNSLDACEEAGILPDITIEVEELQNDRFRIVIEDNGPGIVKRQIPNIFGKLLYGSKFHRLKMSRGQQGIGISAAGMYGMLTTGKPVEIISRTNKNRPAHLFKLQIDTKRNKPEIISDLEVDWDVSHGTRVSIELEGKHTRGKQSVDEYLQQTAIANPHVQMLYKEPGGQAITYKRSSSELPMHTSEIKPHPYGVELGVLQAMLKDSKARSISGFLQSEFSRVSQRVAEEICTNAEISSKAYTSRIGRHDVEKLMLGITSTKIMNPPTNCVAPIGEEQLGGTCVGHAGRILYLHYPASGSLPGQSVYYRSSSCLWRGRTGCRCTDASTEICQSRSAALSAGRLLCLSVSGADQLAQLWFDPAARCAPIRSSYYSSTHGFGLGSIYQ